MSSFSLQDLEAIIEDRASVTDGSSWTAKLVAAGLEKATKKLGEEAIETIIAANAENAENVTAESADLLYHLMVVLHMRGIKIEDVLAELGDRTKQSGMAEKAARSKR
jgi:phosphoribosyl-ATP pyrophosphohydrolase